MPWLLLAWSLTFGYLPVGGTVLSTDLATLNDGRENYFQQTFSLRATVGGIVSIYGDVKTFDYFRPDVGMFSPFEAEYTIGAEASYGPFSIGARHCCDHPVNGWITEKRGTERYGGFTELYVQIRGEMKW